MRIVRSSRSSKSSVPASSLRRSYSRNTRCARSAGIGGSCPSSPPRYVSGVSRRFFAHSTSVARSPAGRNLYGGGSRLPIWRSSSAFVERMRPGSPAKRRSSASAAEWNVDARTPSTPSACEPRPQLAGRLVGERDRDDVRRRERAARHLPGDSPRDRRRLAGARAREDADRPVRRLDGGALLVVQSGEDLLGVHGSPTVPGRSADFVTRGCRIQPWTRSPARSATRCASPASSRPARSSFSPSPQRSSSSGSRTYAPLSAVDSGGYAPGPGLGADIEPVTGSGGKTVFIPAYRAGRPFDTAFTLHNTGRFAVEVTGLGTRQRRSGARRRRRSSRRARRRRMPTRGTCSRSGDLRLDRGDTAVVVVRWRLDCAASKAEFFAASVPLRYTT